VISVSRRSIAVWMSSSVGAKLNEPSSSSRLTRRSPRSMAVSLAVVMIFAALSPRACATLPAMS